MKRYIMGLLSVMTLALLLSPSVVTQAQDAPTPREEKKTESRTDDRIAVDFTYEGLIFIDVNVNDKGPYKFLFDSGAGKTVVNARLADELGLEQHEMPGGAVQGVGTAEAKLTILDDLEIGEYSRGKCLAASMNLDHISGSLGFHMMGIVGQNVFKMIKEIEFDFPANKLYFTEFTEKEMPEDPDKLAISMLEGMGGGGGIPGLPFPKPDDEPDDGEDEFSFDPAFSPGQWLFSPGNTANRGDVLQDEPKTEAVGNPNPTESLSLTYTSVSLPLLGDINPFWNVECTVNGETRNFMFDTGASMLLILSTELGNDLKVTKSFGYPVKGVGTGSADSTMIDSFQIGGLAMEQIPASITELPKVTDALPEMLKMMVPMLKQRGIQVDFDGIVGLTLATRFKSMKVNTRKMTIDFTPYAANETNPHAPYASEDFVEEGVIRTWHGKAGKFALKGDAVPLDDWKELGLESGGMKVEEVEEGGAAAKAGIKAGDILTHLVGLADEVEGEELEDAEEIGGDVVIRDMPALVMIGCNKDPGSEVTVRLKRGEEVLEVRVILDKYGWEGTIPEKYKQK